VSGCAWVVLCLQDIVVQKGLGSWIQDTKGNKYLDMTAGVLMQPQQPASRACHTWMSVMWQRSGCLGSCCCGAAVCLVSSRISSCLPQGGGGGAGAERCTLRDLLSQCGSTFRASLQLSV
jgi:hypothetical protein